MNGETCYVRNEDLPSRELGTQERVNQESEARS